MSTVEKNQTTATSTTDIDPRSFEAQRSEDRKKEVMLSTQKRHIIQRMVHSVTGHPREKVYYGDMVEGATCKCGSHWGPADLRR